MPLKNLCFLCNEEKAEIYFPFPKDPMVHSLWVKACGLTAKDETTHIRICGAHFKTEDFVDLYGIRAMLKKYAVPSLYLNNCPSPDKSDSSFSDPEVIHQTDSDESIDTDGSDSTLEANEITDFQNPSHSQKNNRTGYNNPLWLKNKIEEKKHKISILEKENQIYLNKIREMKIALAPLFKRKAGRGHKLIKNELNNCKLEPPSEDYSGFQGLLKEASDKNLDKTSVINKIYASVGETFRMRYDNAYQDWLSFCFENNYQIFESKTSEILSFFISLLTNTNFKYVTLMIYKKAIMGITSERADAELTLFFQELNDLMCPSRSLNSSTWNPHTLLLNLSERFPNEILSLKHLTQKVVTLLALVTKVRLKSIAQVKLEDVRVTENEVEISFVEYVTTSICKNDRIIVNFPNFNETPQLCVASALRHYKDRLSALRLTNQEYLFIDLNAGDSPVSLTLLNILIRNTMIQAGQDMQIFSNYSKNLKGLTDHQNEVLFDEIKKKVKWTDNMLIFTHFYNIV